MGLKWLLSMQPYGDLWRRGRKLLHGHVHQGVAPQYHPVQIESARRFIREILLTKTEKEALPHAIQSNFGRSIIKMIYGIDAKGDDSEYITIPERVLANISEGGTPGRFLVDFIPMRKCLITLRACVISTDDDDVFSQVRSRMVSRRWVPALCGAGSNRPPSHA
jgi:hypothetical protein